MAPARRAFVCNPVRTPIGRFGGALSAVRTDDLGVVPITALREHLPKMDWAAVDDVIYGATNQAGEDNRDVARMVALLAGLPDTVPGVTVNRLCASGAEAVIQAARAVMLEHSEVMIAGGVESMSRAPYVLGKAQSSFSRTQELFDTSIGWRFVNPKMEQMHGTHSMPETAENVAEEFSVSREDQDAFAARSQERAAVAMENGRFAREIVPVTIPRRKQEPLIVDRDEHPRPGTTAEKLAKLPTPFRANGSVTAGNASGVNDGAAAMLVASESAVNRFGLEPVAHVVGSAVVGVPPRIMGMGPAPAIEKLLERQGLTLDQIDVLEINEAFAAQALAVTRRLGLADDASHVNPNGGAIALGHPLGMTGARLVQTASLELQTTGGRYAIASMCIGVGQGIAVLLERV
ncbi:MAG: 3-oxoadipyl-CoA thiolase [Myxococcota bacterium]